MRMYRSPIIAALVMTVVASDPTAAQVTPEFTLPQPEWLVGYVTNLPDQLLGGAVAAIPRGLGGWGLYVDAKTGTGSPADESSFISDVTRQEAESQFGDLFQNDRSVWRSVNVAVVRAFRPDVVVYAGGGVSRQEAFVRFLDEQRERGDEFGTYWVRDTEAEGWRPNVMGGMLFRLARHIGISFGAEAAPAGFTVGALAIF